MTGGRSPGGRGGGRIPSRSSTKSPGADKGTGDAGVGVGPGERTVRREARSARSDGMPVPSSRTNAASLGPGAEDGSPLGSAPSRRLIAASLGPVLEDGTSLVSAPPTLMDVATLGPVFEDGTSLESAPSEEMGEEPAVTENVESVEMETDHNLDDAVDVSDAEAAMDGGSGRTIYTTASSRVESVANRRGDGGADRTARALFGDGGTSAGLMAAGASARGAVVLSRRAERRARSAAEQPAGSKTLAPFTPFAGSPARGRMLRASGVMGYRHEVEKSDTYSTEVQVTRLVSRAGPCIAGGTAASNGRGLALPSEGRVTVTAASAVGALMAWAAQSGMEMNPAMAADLISDHARSLFVGGGGVIAGDESPTYKLLAACAARSRANQDEEEVEFSSATSDFSDFVESLAMFVLFEGLAGLQHDANGRSSPDGSAEKQRGRLFHDLRSWAACPPSRLKEYVFELTVCIGDVELLAGDGRRIKSQPGAGGRPYPVLRMVQYLYGMSDEMEVLEEAYQASRALPQGCGRVWPRESNDTVWTSYRPASDAACDAQRDLYSSEPSGEYECPISGKTVTSFTREASVSTLALQLGLLPTDMGARKFFKGERRGPDGMVVKPPPRIVVLVHGEKVTGGFFKPQFDTGAGGDSGGGKDSSDETSDDSMDEGDGVNHAAGGGGAAGHKPQTDVFKTSAGASAASFPSTRGREGRGFAIEPPPRGNETPPEDPHRYRAEHPPTGAGLPRRGCATVMPQAEFLANHDVRVSGDGEYLEKKRRALKESHTRIEQENGYDEAASCDRYTAGSIMSAGAAFTSRGKGGVTVVRACGRCGELHGTMRVVTHTTRLAEDTVDEDTHVVWCHVCAHCSRNMWVGPELYLMGRMTTAGVLWQSPRPAKSVSFDSNPAIGDSPYSERKGGGLMLTAAPASQTRRAAESEEDKSVREDRERADAMQGGSFDALQAELAEVRQRKARTPNAELKEYRELSKDAADLTRMAQAVGKANIEREKDLAALQKEHVKSPTYAVRMKFEPVATLAMSLLAMTDPEKRPRAVRVLLASRGVTRVALMRAMVEGALQAQEFEPTLLALAAAAKSFQLKGNHREEEVWWDNPRRVVAQLLEELLHADEIDNHVGKHASIAQGTDTVEEYFVKLQRSFSLCQAVRPDVVGRFPAMVDQFLRNLRGPLKAHVKLKNSSNGTIDASVGEICQLSDGAAREALKLFREWAIEAEQYGRHWGGDSRSGNVRERPSYLAGYQRPAKAWVANSVGDMGGVPDDDLELLISGTGLGEAGLYAVSGNGPTGPDTRPWRPTRGEARGEAKPAVRREPGVGGQCCWRCGSADHFKVDCPERDDTVAAAKKEKMMRTLRQAPRSDSRTAMLRFLGGEESQEDLECDVN